MARLEKCQSRHFHCCTTMLKSSQSFALFQLQFIKLRNGEFSNFSSCQYVWSCQNAMLRDVHRGRRKFPAVGLIKRRCTGKEFQNERVFCVCSDDKQSAVDLPQSLSLPKPHHRHPTKLRQNMSIKISNNIGFCVHEEFFKLRERDRGKIIISNHVLFLHRTRRGGGGGGGRGERKKVLNALFALLHSKWKHEEFFAMKYNDDEWN